MTDLLVAVVSQQFPCPISTALSLSCFTRGLTPSCVVWQRMHNPFVPEELTSFIVEAYVELRQQDGSACLLADPLRVPPCPPR